jgi:DNA-binding NarL/FixJ family response regulator
MRPTRIFILYDHPLFARGLERLLQGVRHLAVVGSAAWHGVEVLPAGAAQADVVLLEKPRGTTEASAAVTRLLASRPEARVLCLSLENNQITVYSAHSLTATEQSDLVRALRSRTATRAPRGGGET